MKDKQIEKLINIENELASQVETLTRDRNSNCWRILCALFPDIGGPGSHITHEKESYVISDVVPEIKDIDGKKMFVFRAYSFKKNGEVSKMPTVIKIPL